MYKLNTYNDTKLYTVIGLLSLLGSFVAVTWLSPLINSDGTVFLSAAEIYKQHGFNALKQAYPYPTYPLLIGTVSDVLSISSENAAQLLDAIFYSVLAVSFTAVAAISSPSKKAMLLAGICILIFPNINEFKGDIYRDPGYWCLSITALFFLTKSIQQKSAYFFIAWACCQTAAGLFRIEGLLLLSVPTLLMIVSWRELRHHKAFIVYAIIMGVAALTLLTIFTDAISASVNHVFQDSIQSINQASERLGASVLNVHSQKHSLGIYLTGTSYLVIKSIISNVGVFFIVAVLTVHMRKTDQKLQPLILIYLLISLLPLIYQSTTQQFLQARYSVLSSILILLLLVTHFFTRIDHTQKSFGVFLFFAVALLADGFINTGASPNHNLKAITYIHNQLPADVKAISNSRTVNFGIDRLINPKHGTTDRVSCKAIKQYEYYLHTIGKKQPPLPKCIRGYQPIKIFTNEKNHSASLYKIK